MHEIAHLSALGLIGLALLSQVSTCALVLLRHHRRTGRALARCDSVSEAITLVRPVCGFDHRLEETLRSAFTPAARHCEILFCIADAEDPAIPVVRRVIDAHPDNDARLLIGDDPVSGNPKLNNSVKGWREARHAWIAMIDSNVLLPADWFESLLEARTPRTGLVTSPPTGSDAQGFWSEIECAFLNTHQAKWQLACDAAGHGFAQGKVLMWRRDVLEAAGGITMLGREMAEDIASTKIVRSAGLEVHLVARLFEQPIGPRRFADVWDRQVRWARVRRLGFPILFASELPSGGVVPLLVAAVLAGQGKLPVWTVPLLGIIWYAAEWLLAVRCGWPMSIRQLAACIVRDALLPAVWMASWRRNAFVWRGNRMSSRQVLSKQGPR